MAKGNPRWHVHGPGITQATVLTDTPAGIQDMHEVPVRIDSGPAQGSRVTVQLTPDQFADPAQARQALQEAVDAHHQVACMTDDGEVGV